MKKVCIALVMLLIAGKSFAQETDTAAQRVITTGVPFLLIAADARAAGLGDMGVESGQIRFCTV